MGVGVRHPELREELTGVEQEENEFTGVGDEEAEVGEDDTDCSKMGEVLKGLAVGEWEGRVFPNKGRSYFTGQ